MANKKQRIIQEVTFPNMVTLDIYTMEIFMEAHRRF